MGIEKDNLDSVQVARIIDLLSEGEIEGFPNAKHPDGVKISRTTALQQYYIASLKDTFFNNTPVLAANAPVNSGTTLADVRSYLNFDMDDALFESRLGTQDQDVTENIGIANQSTTAVNVKIENNTAVTRQITDTDVTAVRVTVGTPALQRIEKDGDIEGEKIKYKIEIQYNSGGYQQVGSEHEIRGRTPDLYQRKHLIIFSPTGAFPVDIRITRTFQNTSDKHTIIDDFFWYDFTSRVDDKTRFPNSALVALRFDAQQFPNIPDRSYRIRGVKVKIPHNATVNQTTGALTYSGTFGGTFKTTKEWTTDPAFILYDLLTNTRYGLGNHVLTPEERAKDAAGNFDGAADVASNLDIYSFQAASAYCGETVTGDDDPRFSCNVSIQSSFEAYDLINQLCSVFRVMPFWQAGGLSVAQDRKTEDPNADFTYVFNQTNVTEAGFQYSGSSMKTRHTCVSVKYFDMDLRDYVYELIEDEEAIKKYGYNKTSINAFACNSRKQANRLGKWLLYTQQYETEIVSFETDLAAGITVRPGDFIKIGDPVKAGQTVCGRFTSGSTTTSLKLDRSDVDMFGTQAPSTFTMNLVLPDGTYQQQAGCTIVGNTVTPPSAFRLAPVQGAPFAIGFTGLNLSTWRVVSVGENEDTYSVTASYHDRNKYDFIEQDVEFTQRDITQLNEPPEAPSNLVVEEVLYESAGRVLQKLVIGWQASARANNYRVRYRFNDNNFVTATTANTGFEIQNSDVGTYEVEVYALSYGIQQAKESQRASTTFVAVGKTAAPSNIASLNISPVDAHTAELYWPQSVDLDVRVGGSVEIRHTPHTDANAVWGRAQDIVPAVNGSSTRKIVPLKEGTYLIRAKDSLGNYAAPTGIPSVVVDLPEPQDLELVQTYTENPSFGGTFSNMFYSEAEGGIALTSGGLIDDITDFDAVTSIDFFGDLASSGEYQFASTLDLGAKYDVELLSVLQIRAFQPSDTWDDRTALIDTWNDIDADDLSDTDVQLYVRSTNDNPSGSPTYGTWEPFVNNTKRGRGFQFKAVATSSNVSQNPLIEQLGVKVRLQRRTEQQRNITSGTSAKAVTFPSAFYSIPSVGITAQDFDSGDYFQLSSISRTGFTVTFKNSSDTIISKVFDYMAVAHGKEIS